MDSVIFIPLYATLIEPYGKVSKKQYTWVRFQGMVLMVKTRL